MPLLPPIDKALPGNAPKSAPTSKSGSLPPLFDTDLIKQLQVLEASLDMTCIKSRGFSKNVVAQSFYEFHTFLNLTIECLHHESYHVGERIRSLGGMANFCLEDIENKSAVKDQGKLLTDFGQMVDVLHTDWKTLSDLARNIFKAAGENGDAGTIGCIAPITTKIEHFLWELGAMAR
jgi:DNA-binding ferritin-like protein